MVHFVCGNAAFFPFLFYILYFYFLKSLKKFDRKKLLPLFTDGKTKPLNCNSSLHLICI